MAVEKWTAGAGVGLTWTAIFGAGADLNSMANASSVMSSTGDIANDTALDIFADLSVQLGSATWASPSMISVFAYPLNGDGTTYGDNQLTAGTQAAKVPAPQFWVGNINFPNGAAAAFGTLERIIMPPGKFRFVIQNNGGVAMAATGNAVQYRTYNRSVA